MLKQHGAVTPAESNILAGQVFDRPHPNQQAWLKKDR